MKLSHIGVWTNDLEGLKNFYVTYFGGKTREKYVNPVKKFESYFIDFEGNGSVNLEIMKLATTLESGQNQTGEMNGFAHIAFSVGSKEQVDLLTERLALDGYVIVSKPRTTGDGYYESCILDPDRNHIEITI
ncbi:MAG: glyoxalase/bleomycin resistance/extradiol dioxygenase family protein [Firmicutes bacterium HGW-Firmicutes-1]|jgi:lactoylglutathione lyase|nr:MAG: glyoxalase/bleomycin resistance/extradiol dioxygenase family protein [Firmicutes bacterium HGW-Firmicutes-1]